jgi:ribosome modulation factor
MSTSIYFYDPSDYCPGCNRIRCSCPTAEQEDYLQEMAYERGYQDGLELGPHNRPSLDWLLHPFNPHREPLAEDYLKGYSDGAAGRPNLVATRYEDEEERRRKALSEAAQATVDDGLPF